MRKIETDASCKRRRRQRRRQRLSRFTIIHNGERARDEGQSRGGRRVARPPRTGSPNLSTAPWQHGRSVAAGRSVDPTLMAVCLAIYAPNGPTPSFLPSLARSLARAAAADDALKLEAVLSIPARPRPPPAGHSREGLTPPSSVTWKSFISAAPSRRSRRWR